MGGKRINLALVGIGLCTLGLAFLGSDNQQSAVEVSQIAITSEQFIVPVKKVMEIVGTDNQYQYYCGPNYYGPVGSPNGGWHHPYQSLRRSPNEVEARDLLEIAKGA